MKATFFDLQTETDEFICLDYANPTSCTISVYLESRLKEVFIFLHFDRLMLI